MTTPRPASALPSTSPLPTGEGQGEGAYATATAHAAAHVSACLVLLLLLAPAPTAQPSPGVRLHVLADSVSLGERFEAAVAVDHPAGRSVTFPAPPPGLPEAAPGLAFGDAEVLSARRLAPTARGTTRTDSVVYTLAVFELDAALGPVRIQLSTPGDTTQLESGVVDLAVRSETAGEASPQPAPPEPPFSFPSAWWIWALVALAAAGIAALAVPWMRRRFGRRHDDTVRLPPYAEARGRLETLSGAPLDDTRAPERIVVLAEVLRTFLGRRLGVPALEATTSELDAALADDDRVPGAARDAARDVLRIADLVKFADATPGADTARDALQKVRDAVDTVEGAARTAEAAASDTPETDDAASESDAPSEPIEESAPPSA